MGKFLSACFFIAISTQSMQAQTLDDPLVTDRPDATESAFTIPQGSFQIETGIIYESTDFKPGNNNISEQAIHLATTLFRYGTWKNFELRFGTMYSIINRKVGDNERDKSGINRILLSAKFHVLEENGILPEAAILANVRFPTGDFENVTRYALFITASHTLSDMFSLGYNIGTAKEEGDWEFVYTLSLGAGLSNKAGVFAEVFGNFAAENHWLDAGLTYLVNNDLQLDASFGYGLDTHFPDWFINGGVSIRIPN